MGLCLLLLVVTGGVDLEVTLMICLCSPLLEEEAGVDETTGVIVVPAGRGDGPWLILRVGGEGEDVGLSKHIT